MIIGPSTFARPAVTARPTPPPPLKNTLSSLLRYPDGQYGNPHCFTLALLMFAWPLNYAATARGQNSRTNNHRNTLLFISDVLAKTEYDNSNQARTVRWEKSPRLSVFGDRNRHAVLVQRSISEINKVLPEKCRIKHLPDETATASIKLYFIEEDQFEKVARSNGFDSIKGNRGLFNVKWNDKYEIENACVMIAEDKLSGKILSHFVLEELTQVMGLVGDSTRVHSSLFYENPSAHQYGDATHLTSLDRRLIKFLYEHVPAGSFPIELGVLVERHWNPADKTTAAPPVTPRVVVADDAQSPR